MLTEEDIAAFQTRTVTTICTESHPGYPDPLIYSVEVPLNASPAEITEMVIQERIEELGPELEDEVRATFHVCLAIEGELNHKDYVFDHRI